jgi:hypothetical protein
MEKLSLKNRKCFVFISSDIQRRVLRVDNFDAHQKYHFLTDSLQVRAIPSFGMFI